MPRFLWLSVAAALLASTAHAGPQVESAAPETARAASAAPAAIADLGAALQVASIGGDDHAELSARVRRLADGLWSLDPAAQAKAVEVLQSPAATALLGDEQRQIVAAVARAVEERSQARAEKTERRAEQVAAQLSGEAKQAEDAPLAVEPVREMSWWERFRKKATIVQGGGLYIDGLHDGVVSKTAFQAYQDRSFTRPRLVLLAPNPVGPEQVTVRSWHDSWGRKTYTIGAVPAPATKPRAKGGVLDGLGAGAMGALATTALAMILVPLSLGWSALSGLWNAASEPTGADLAGLAMAAALFFAAFLLMGVVVVIGPWLLAALSAALILTAPLVGGYYGYQAGLASGLWEGVNEALLSSWVMAMRLARGPVGAALSADPRNETAARMVLHAFRRHPGAYARSMGELVDHYALERPALVKELFRLALKSDGAAVASEALVAFGGAAAQAHPRQVAEALAFAARSADRVVLQRAAHAYHYHGETVRGASPAMTPDVVETLSYRPRFGRRRY